ncbi:hypothetical protein EON63_24090 [archaeon]|nr:MAG: hypothetical protein EON63_24090 [archaeon]
MFQVTYTLALTHFSHHAHPTPYTIHHTPQSGQFFFYSHDGKYMLKTQTKEENKFMRRILPQYYKYMTDNPHSLLVRILGECLFGLCMYIYMCMGIGIFVEYE